MPSSSTKQRNYIFYLRGKYKTKKNTPKDQEWIWNDEWMVISESSFRSEVKAWIDPEGNYLPFHRLKNHDDMLPLGLCYGDVLRKDWIRVYKTPDKLHITCCNFDAKKLKCCIKIFNQIDEFKNMEIVVADGSKIINYNPLFKESRFIEPYKRFFKEKVNISEKEQQAIDAYFGMSFGLINRCLRGTDSSSQAEEYIQNIDSVMKRNTIHNLVLYRGISPVLPATQKLVEDLSSAPIGSVFKDPAYMSTSPDIKVAGAWAKRDGIILKLKVKSAHGFHRKEFASYPTNENEVLLDRNVKFKIAKQETVYLYNTDILMISLIQV